MAYKQTSNYSDSELMEEKLAIVAIFRSTVGVST